MGTMWCTISNEFVFVGLKPTSLPTTHVPPKPVVKKGGVMGGVLGCVLLPGSVEHARAGRVQVQESVFVLCLSVNDVVSGLCWCLLVGACVCVCARHRPGGSPASIQPAHPHGHKTCPPEAQSGTVT